jgi:asparagine synthetase B (glutamine-hydrolysing)
MPGLFGLISLSPRTDFREYAEAVLEKMAGPLMHSDDYALNTFVGRDLGLAIGRVHHPSFNNMSWPRQQAAEIPNVTIFIHGFLFGEQGVLPQTDFFDSLTQPDAKTLLSRFSGSYSLVAATAGGRSVVVSVDRKASQPIYYARQEDCILFAPEVKAILPLLCHRPELDTEAAATLLASGHVLTNHTLISSIKRLPGGCFLEIRSGRMRVGSYWCFRPGSTVDHTSEEELREELARLINEAVKKNFENPAKTIIFLSGGVDSRAILGGALAIVGGDGNRINTASWGLQKDIPGSDATVAEMLSKKLRLRHSFFRRELTDYGRNFEETNYLVDGLSDVAAFHPYEFTIMKRIKGMGFDRALRGDETFGWQGRVYNCTQAKAEVGIRSLETLNLYSKLLQPRYFRMWCEASAAAIAPLDSEIQGMEANDAKDYLYYTQRLQCYLNIAAYYKQVVLDHRNPLLDDSTLEFLARVPWRLRIDKRLYRETVQTACPSLWTVPIIGKSRLENWTKELAAPSALQEYVKQQLTDANSEIWEYFDQPALMNLFESIRAHGERAPKSQARAWLRDISRKTLILVAPRAASQIRSSRTQSMVAPYEALFRFLVLKNWHDRYF